MPIKWWIENPKVALVLFSLGGSGCDFLISAIIDNNMCFLYLCQIGLFHYDIGLGLGYHCIVGIICSTTTVGIHTY